VLVALAELCADLPTVEGVVAAHKLRGRHIYPPGAGTDITPPAGLYSITAQYNGDSNFLNSTSSAFLLEVGSPLVMAASPSTVKISNAGQSGSTTLTITPQVGFSGTISNFACSGLPPEATCSFQPASINGPGSVTVTITTTPIGQVLRSGNNTTNGHRPDRTEPMVLPVLAVFFVGIPNWKRRRDLLTLLLVILLMLMIPSCGGGSGGGGGGTPPPGNPVPSITSLSPAQLAGGSQSQTLTINGAGFARSSEVSYNAASRTATYVSASQLSIALSGSDLAQIGTYPVVVTNPAPGGGNSNPANFSVVKGTPTGTFNVTVTASSGPLSAGTTFFLSIQ
jgi:hypothetical protein